jgi:hypothetical protein
VFHEWGMAMMREAMDEADPEHRRIRYLNGLRRAHRTFRMPPPSMPRRLPIWRSR